MRELLYINIEDSGFGIWNDEVLAVKENLVLHHLPLTGKILAGFAEIDGRVVTAADLGACIGLPQIKSRRCHVLVLSGSQDIAGFAIEQKVKRYEISPDKIFKLPDCLHSQIINTCVIYSSASIPVINIEALYRLVKNIDYSPENIQFRKFDSRPADLPADCIYKYLTVGRETFAFPGYNLRDEMPAPGNAAGSVLFPEYIKGITLYNDSILPLVSLSSRMDIAETGSEQHALIAGIEKNTFGFLADALTGESKEGIRPVSLPPIAQSGLMKQAIIDNGKAIPVVDPAALILPKTDAYNILLESLYVPENAFENDFGKTDAEVMEFYLLNSIYSVPRSEVKDTIPYKEIRKVPGTMPIVIGVTEYGGGLLPVLDLALYFGVYSPVSSDWKMILVENGSFRAFLITKQINGTRVVKSSHLSILPIRQPHNVVYGCYPDSVSGTMRLILNAESMAVHFDKDYIREFFNAFSREEHSSLPETKIPRQESGPTVIEDAIPSVSEQVEEPQIAAQPQADVQAAAAEEPRMEKPAEIFSEIKTDTPVPEPQCAEEDTTLSKEPAEEYTAMPDSDIVSEPDISREKNSVPEPIYSLPGIFYETPQEEVLEDKTREEESAEAENIFSEIQSADEEITEPAAYKIPEDAPPVFETPAYRISPSEEKNKISEMQSPVKVTQTDEKADENQYKNGSSMTGMNLSIEKINPAEKIEPADESEISASQFYKREKNETGTAGKNSAETGPAVIITKTPPSAKNSYIYAALGLLVIILIFLISAFFLSHRNPADKEKQAVTVKEEKNLTRDEKTQPREKIIPAGDKKIDVTVPDQSAKSASLNKINKSDTPPGGKETEKIKGLPPKYGSQTDLESTSDFIIYKVISGDELYYITEQFTGNGFDYWTIAKDNKIDNPDLIFPEQKIKLKKEYIKK